MLRALPLVFAMLFAAAAAPRVRIILVGDSTVAPNSGWGSGFCALADPAEITCINMGKGGRSSGSYRAEGWWDKVMAELKNAAGFDSTYVLMEFGHNDQPGKAVATNLETEFPANMARYVREVREAGGKPVLMTPLTRRTFRSFQVKDTLGPWADAIRKVAEENHVPLMDLNAESMAAVNQMGPAEADTLAAAPPPAEVVAAEPSGTSIAAPKSDAAPQFDYTHVGPKGAEFFGRMAAGEFTRAVTECRLTGSTPRLSCK